MVAAADRCRETLPSNPIDRLELVARIVGECPDVGPALGQWVADGVRRHVETGESMDRILGFSGVLGRSPRFVVLRRRRNALLLRALVLVDGDMHRLKDEIDRYFRVRVAYVQRCAPIDWSAPRKLIHEADGLGIAIPRTLDGLRLALSTNKGGDVPS